MGKKETLLGMGITVASVLDFPAVRWELRVCLPISVCKLLKDRLFFPPFLNGTFLSRENRVGPLTTIEWRYSMTGMPKVLK